MVAFQTIPHLVILKTRSSSSSTPLTLNPTFKTIRRIKAFRASQRRNNSVMMTQQSTAIPLLSLLHPLSITSIPRLDWSVSTSDVTLTCGILTAVVAWLLVWQQLTSRSIVSSLVTRKVIHITSGPAFIVLWPFYSNNISSRFLAASIPALFGVLLVTSGLSTKSDGKRAALGRAISRRDDAREALGGPLYYTLILLSLTLFAFKHVVAAVAVMQLCVGDGMAEVVGRKLGYLRPWPVSWAKHKSVVGSTAFAVCSFVASVVAVGYFQNQGLIQNNGSVVMDVHDMYTIARLALISVGCAAVELAPTRLVGDDNVAIAVLAVFLTVVLFQ